MIYVPVRKNCGTDFQNFALNLNFKNFKFGLVSATGAVELCMPTSFGFLMGHKMMLITPSLTAALDQLRVVASSTSNDPGPRSRQHQQIGQRLLPLAADNRSVKEIYRRYAFQSVYGCAVACCGRSHFFTADNCEPLLFAY